MDNVEGHPQPSVDIDKSRVVLYPVTLRTHLVAYVVEQLKPRFDQEKLAIQERDGTYQELMDFTTKSPFGNLMQRLEGQPGGVDNEAEHRIINLSQEDMSLIKRNIASSSSGSYADAKIHNEVMEELGMKFDSAKTKAHFKKAVGNIKDFIKRK